LGYGIESGGNRRFRTRREEAQGGNPIDDRADCQLSLVQPISLPLADVVRAEPIRRFPKVARELLDRAQITAYSV
jgi:hypothetical protein